MQSPESAAFLAYVAFAVVVVWLDVGIALGRTYVTQFKHALLKRRLRRSDITVCLSAAAGEASASGREIAPPAFFIMVYALLRHDTPGQWSAGE
jgi:hypothetical protein